MHDSSVSAESDVELVFNCFERTIEYVTESDVLHDLALENSYPFARRTLLVNNVESPRKWLSALDRLVSTHVVDRWLSVADALPQALAVTGLRMRDIRPRQHWSDFALVAVSLPGPSFVCYCDPEVELAVPGDWITPSIALMNSDPRVAVTNPRWTASSAVEEKADEIIGDFLVGYGFTDQVFLAKRDELARPIYRSWLPIAVRSPASLRYPAAFDSAVFEMRVDAYMRAKKRRRATHRWITYTHATPEGSSYDADTPLRRIRRIRNHAILKVLVEAHFTSPRLRLQGLMTDCASEGAEPRGPRTDAP